MSSNRGLANQALFRAQILLEAWELTESQGRREPSALVGAFLPAVCEHLLNAYGWFLLAVTQADAETDATRLPRGVAALSAPPAGKSVAPEVREFEHLEHEGWLADLLAAAAGPQALALALALAPAPARGAPLLASDRRQITRAEVARWADLLSSTMLRMDDSLNEC